MISLADDDPTGSVVVPLVTALGNNYPNPFNPSTTITYTVGNAFMRSASAESTGEAVRISVYNIKGQLVKTLVNEYKEAGQHKVVWNGESEQGKKMSSGIYFYRMETKRGNITKKMLLVK
jgi:flagellar hook assembly protein FlgD